MSGEFDTRIEVAQNRLEELAKQMPHIAEQYVEATADYLCILSEDLIKAYVLKYPDVTNGLSQTRMVSLKTRSNAYKTTEREKIISALKDEKLWEPTYVICSDDRVVQKWQEAVDELCTRVMNEVCILLKEYGYPASDTIGYSTFPVMDILEVNRKYSKAATIRRSSAHLDLEYSSDMQRSAKEYKDAINQRNAASKELERIRLEKSTQEARKKWDEA